MGKAHVEAELLQRTAVQVVEAQGPCLDRPAMAKLAAAVEAASRTRPAGIVLDVSPFERATAGGLAALLTWVSETAPRSQGIVLAAPQRDLLLAILQARLQQELDVYCTVEAARARTAAG